MGYRMISRPGAVAIPPATALASFLVKSVSVVGPRSHLHVVRPGQRQHILFSPNAETVCCRLTAPSGMLHYAYIHDIYLIIIFFLQPEAVSDYQ